MARPIEPPCHICGEPYDPDYADGVCENCEKPTCAGCMSIAPDGPDICRECVDALLREGENHG